MFLCRSIILRYMTLVTNLHIYTLKDNKVMFLNLTSFTFPFLFFHHTNISLNEHKALVFLLFSSNLTLILYQHPQLENDTS